MVMEAVDAEAQFAQDLLGGGVAGCRRPTCAATSSTSPTGGSSDSGFPAAYGSRNPLAFMELQDVQELSNFFERRVSAYQVGVTGAVTFDDEF